MILETSRGTSRLKLAALAKKKRCLASEIKLRTLMFLNFYGKGVFTVIAEQELKPY